ncbi:hypothetical protein GGU10DRAFT_389082 [Lentinula aff. detonsa]|uniref:Uncharacterized protein n=1 Tax=Lentinula aff. detonsa TaxID=2804958 RepID=A0AA38KDF8_9AGAR|nr:hypothetical protein GGU10DRAFT_389082 [Lentinula aff. detonsa]
MRNSNPKEVPSYKALREEQAKLRDLCGIQSIQYKSQQGDIYYLNDIANIMKKNFENPEIAPHIMYYPEDTDGAPRSEFTQFARLREKPEQLTPSFQKDNKHFYVNELASLSNGCLVIPLIWVTVKGKVHAYCRMVNLGSNGLVVDEADVRVPASELDLNFPEILAEIGSLDFTEESTSYAASMPNKYHELDQDEDHIVIWMPVWADDVSGARSKQYQKHVNVYMCNGSLPGKLVQQEYHVNFVGSSQQVSATEMLGQATHANPVRCYNAATGSFCRFRIQVPYLPADNPQQSEECSHIGHNGSFPCQICHVGGTYAETETNEGYEAFYNVGQPRSSTETRDAIFKQICLASRGVATHVDALKTKSGTADKTAQYWIDILLKKSSELRQKNPQQSVDDISIELLLWLVTQTKQPYNPLLDNELFHIQDIVSENRFNLVKALGELGAVLWITEIDDLDQYLEDLVILIANVLDAWALIDPAKILRKIKLHLLVHLPEHIRRFGPSVRFSTEVFECFNAVFRMCSVLSNHQAPSRDIAMKNGELGRLKHIISGGHWVRNGHIEHAGNSVIAVLQSTPIIQRHLGWVPPRQLKPGMVQCPGRDKRTTLVGTNTQAFTGSTFHPGITPSSSWILGTHVISQSEDICPIGSWVIVRYEDNHFIAQVVEILHPAAADAHSVKFVTVQKFTLSQVLHHYYQMPVLHEPEEQYTVVESTNIQFIINVQHDCRAAKCCATGSHRQRQERTESGREIACIEHVPLKRYIINTHTLHNAARLVKWHNEIATELCISQATKRAQSKAQAAATRLKNKEKNQAGPQAGSAPVRPGTDESRSRKRQHVQISEESNGYNDNDSMDIS